MELQGLQHMIFSLRKTALYALTASSLSKLTLPLRFPLDTLDEYAHVVDWLSSTCLTLVPV